jgi:hypothetical protein
MPYRNLEALIAEHATALAVQMHSIAESAHSEEDVRHGCNKLIEDFLEEAGLQIKGRHEYGLAGGRIDSKYAGVIIEYKAPKGSSKITDSLDAPATKTLVEQIKKRFRDFQREEHVEPERLFGVGTDAQKILFVRQRGREFEIEDPKPITPHSVARLLRALISLGAQGKSFTPDHLAADFGSESPVAQKGIRQLYAVISQTKNPKARTFFNQWKILFGEVCGYDVEGQNEKIKKLAEHYGLPKSTRPAELLFAVHTYYAVFMKFLAAEVVSSFSPLAVSTIKRCVGAPTATALKREMEQLEQGGIWTQLGITNFLEGDLFSWYLAAWDERVAEVFEGIVRRLDEYDPSTLSVEPTESRDLLKKLYQQLFPKSVRHDLGEYYTPDWLAEHVLNRLEYAGDPDKRLLDPACGSGTFLVLAINRIKEWFAEHRHECGYGEAELVKKILRNVIGFDLNPLAVMAARTNYLIAIRDLLRYAERIEIPVYLCDSIMTPAEYGELFPGHRLGTAKRLKTAAGEFLIPTEVLGSREQVGRYADLLEFCIRNEYTAEEFLARCAEEGFAIEIPDLHEKLYKKLQKLDEENQNGIWARIIKNAFAPIFTERVDYVVGNPPWVNWESLPKGYRDEMKPLWQRYGLFSLSGTEGRLGGGKKDLSMLFVYCSVDYYLCESGQLGFVITQSVFKTKGAGDGFRRFKFSAVGSASSSDRTVFITPKAVDDMSDFQPFEGATNRTAVFVCRKSSKPFQYPVPYIVWRKKAPGRIEQDFTLDKVLQATERREIAAIPVDRQQPTSPWLTAPEAALPGIRKVIGQSYYKAYAGACTWLNSVYWVRILQHLPNGDLLIENLHDVGKIKVEKVQMAIEPDLVYPLLRGRDVQRWRAEPSAYIILAQDPQTRAGIPEDVMKRKYPKTYAYFKKFEEQLRKRSGYRQYFSPEDPFWSMYNVGPYTMSRWKVVFKDLTEIFQCAAIGPSQFAGGVKQILPDVTMRLMPCDDENEARFVAALLNSHPVLTTLHASSVGVQTQRYHPSDIQKIGIPKYVSTDSVHKTLADLSRRCHEAAAKGLTDTVTQLEAEIDRAAAQLWGITDKELKAIQEALREMERSRHKTPEEDDDDDA